MKKTLSLVALVAVAAACSDTPAGPTPATVTAEARPGFAEAAKPSGTTVAELAGVAGLTTLAFAIEQSDAACGTDFGATLGGNRGQFTVFAPTNEAFNTLFAGLPAAVDPLSCDVLPVVLAFHVTRGRHHSGSVLAHDRFRMLSGEYAAVDAAAGTIAGARLKAGALDNSASNGIVHLVDDVLVPGSILEVLASLEN